MTVTLNDDVMLEILRWFVSIDDIGPFTLFHVCKTWRALLLQMPSLWTWIVVDMGADDVEERVEAYIKMSGSLPLRLRIRPQLETIPSVIPWLSPHLPRVDLLIIELPGDALIDSTVVKLLPRVQCFIDEGVWSPNLRVVWLRDNKVESVKSNWLISQDTSWLVTKGLSPRALMMRNHFSTAAVVNNPIWTGPTRLQDVLLGMRSLHNLRISDFRPRFCDPESDSGAKQEKRVQLPHLRHVIFDYLGEKQPRIDYADEHGRVVATFLALQTDRVSILDHLDGLFITIGSLAPHFQPTVMMLYPRDASYSMPFKLTSPLRKLYKLQVSLIELSNKAQEDQLSSMARGLSLLMREVGTLRACELTVSPSTFPFALQFISLTPPTREILYKISVVKHPELVHTTSDSASPLLFSTLPVVDCLEIRPYSISVYGQIRTRQIIIKTRWNAYKVVPTLSAFISTPDGDYSQLQRLDTGRVTFTPEIPGDPSLPKLPSLTTLRCVPIVALHILRSEAAPGLRELTLTDDIYGGDSNTPNFSCIDAILAKLGSNSPHSLEALRWQFYPPWPALFSLCTTLCSPSGSTLTADGAFQVALPSYPSRRILTSLVTALNGDTVEEDVLLKEEPWIFDEFTCHRTHRKLCYYCFCSHRMDCKRNSSVACLRHSRETLVTITRYTLM